MKPIFFDGHHDLLSRMAAGKCSVDEVKSGTNSGHIDWSRAKRGGYGGGFFAIFVEDSDVDLGDILQAMQHPPYHLEMPPEIPHDNAYHLATKQMDALFALKDAGLANICTTTEDIRATLNENQRFAAIFHLEGAEPISHDLGNVEFLYEHGLRSVGLTWSRHNRFAFGAPFAYPSSPNHHDGLTLAGKALVKQCNQMGIMLDVSHLNEKGFDDLATISTAPIVATHSNAHAITPHARNLTDRQLAIIRDSDGLVGVNFATAMLRPDGKMHSETPLDHLSRHLDYLLEALGETRLAFGTDFDGATIPDAISDCTGIPLVHDLLQQSGYSDDLMSKLFHENWLRVLETTW